MAKKSFSPLITMLLLIFLFCGSARAQKQNKIIKLTTNSEEALEYYNKALCGWFQMYEKEALENFKAAVETDPEFVMARALYSLFLSYPENQQMIDEAKKYFGKVTEGEKMFTLAMEANVNNDLAKEIEILKKVVSIYPDDAMAHFQLGSVYSRSKLFFKAMAEYETTVACNPHFYVAYNSLGYGNIRIGKFNEAIKWLKKYSELLPGGANPWDSLGDAYRHAGKYTEAWKCYKKALEIKPDFTGSHIHLGDIKHELGFYEEAIPYYQEALKTLLPEKEVSESHYRVVDSLWRLRLANNYLLMDEVDKAEKEVKTILGHNTAFGNVLGHYLAAEIALKRRNLHRAKEEADLVQKFERENNFLSLEKDQIVNFIKGKIALAEKDLASAEKFTIEAKNSFNKEGQSNFLSSIYPLGNDRNISVEPLNLLSEIRREQHHIDDEVKVIKKSLKLIPFQPNLHYRLGEIYAHQNKREDAERAFKEFLTLCEDFNCSEKDKKRAERFVKENLGYRIIKAEELLERINKREKLILIDCRPDNEYNAGHIPGAVSVSMDSISFRKDTVIKDSIEKIKEKEGKEIHFVLIDSDNGEEYISKMKILELVKYLPEDRNEEVFFYCRRPTCTRSPMASRWTVALGYKNVFRYEGSWKDWIEKKYPIEK